MDQHSRAESDDSVYLCIDREVALKCQKQAVMSSCVVENVCEAMDMPRLALCIQETCVMRNISLYYDSRLIHLLPRDKMPPHPLT